MNATLAFYALGAPPHEPPSLIKVLEHVAAARKELDRFIAADHDDTLDLRVYHGAQFLDDAATVLGGEP